ncbi:MAG TPA: hypothetical protein VJK71_09935, partial [Gemmatimonadales bacterium]|nr:hypothetical protein [Gemmatimonadales bacterium]
MLDARGGRMPGAVVVGDIDLVRPLGLAGIRVAVMAPPGDPARYSRFTRELVEWVDPWDQPEGMVEALLRFGEAQAQPPVLFYEGDPDLLLVSRCRARLATAFRFVVPDQELVEDLVDKARFQQLAARHRLPVPPARHCVPAGEPVPADLGLEFPVVVKPLTRRGESWRPVVGGVKALQVDSLEALERLWPRFATAGLEILVQTLIPGPESNIESYHVYVDGSGTVVGEFTGK